MAMGSYTPALDEAMSQYNKAKKKGPTYADIVPGTTTPLNPPKGTAGITFDPGSGKIVGMPPLTPPPPSSGPTAPYHSVMPSLNQPSDSDVLMYQNHGAASARPPLSSPAAPVASAPAAAPASNVSQLSVNEPPSMGRSLASDKLRAGMEFDDMMRNKYLGQKYAQYSGMGMSPAVAAQMRNEIGMANAAADYRHQIQAGEVSVGPPSNARFAAADEYARRAGVRGAADTQARAEQDVSNRARLAAGEADVAQYQRVGRAAKELPLESPQQQVASAQAKQQIQQISQDTIAQERDQPYVAMAQDVERLKQANPQYGSLVQNIASGIGQLNGKYMTSESETGQYGALQNAWENFMKLPNPLKPAAAREILSMLQSKGIAAPAENSAGSTILSRFIYGLGRAPGAILEGKGKGETDAATKSKDESIKALFNNLRFFAGAGVS